MLTGKTEKFLNKCKQITNEIFKSCTGNVGSLYVKLIQKYRSENRKTEDKVGR